MKIIAFYLPQFHTFPENDKWWGKGFTEWRSVKNAKALFEGHQQPRIPYNENYYDLTELHNLEWQAKLAKQYGIYGFCYYHYWFDGHMLMEKPAEIMLKNKTVDLPFCMCWANEDWTRAWAKKSREVLISQTYSDKSDWERHFYYFLDFFRDDRYIKIEGKPLLILYRPELISNLEDMVACWKRLARENGFKDLCLAYQQADYDHRKDAGGELFNYGIEYQPSLVKNFQQEKSLRWQLRRLFNKVLVQKLNMKQSKFNTIWFDYDDAWQKILNLVPKDEKMLPGAFVDWDNTPRYGKGAHVYCGVTPEKFEYYLAQQIVHAKRVYKKDMLFMFAWNEWGEGGYLEPDKLNGFSMLEAVRGALKVTNEFPEYPKINQ